MIHLMYTYVEAAYCNHCDATDENEDCCKGCGVHEETEADGMKLAMMIEETDTHPVVWEDYYDTDYRYYPIEYCPHCGSKIKIEVVKEENLDSVYRALMAERESLLAKIRKTDSKKKEASLREELRNVDRQIDELHEDCGVYRE